jgi:hypothetical protein
MLRFTGFALLALALSTAARAETINCTVIGNLPFQITAPGIYCLHSSLNVAGDGIIILSDDVVVDLNGHAITGTGHSTGVQSTSEYNRNIIVRNGAIRRFSRGVDIGQGGFGGGVVVEDLRIDAHAKFGILARGRAAIVRRNQVVQNGITGDGQRFGIWVEGPGSIVADNQVVDIGLGAPGQADAIRVLYGAGTVIERNVITNSGPAGGMGKGIHFQSSPGGAAVGNRISGWAVGIEFDSGSNGIYMDNTVGGAVTPFLGGTPAGRTNFSF